MVWKDCSDCYKKVTNNVIFLLNLKVPDKIDSSIVWGYLGSGKLLLGTEIEWISRTT